MKVTPTKHDTRKIQIQITISELLGLIGVETTPRAQKTFITMHVCDTFGGVYSGNFKDRLDIDVSWEEPE